MSLPDASGHRFDSREAARKYALELFRSNQLDRPVYMEQNKDFLDELNLVQKFFPDRNMLLKFSEANNVSGSSRDSLVRPLAEFEQFMDDEARKPGLLRDWTWMDQVLYPLRSFAKYFHDQNLFPEERQALNLMHTLGYRNPDYLYLTMDSLIHEGKISDARQALGQLQQQYPDHYWNQLGRGLLLRLEGKNKESLLAIKNSTEKNPSSFRVRLELAMAYKLMGRHAEAKREKQVAFDLAKNLQQAIIASEFSAIP